MEEASECVKLLDRKQIQLGSKFFTFDQAYDGSSRQESIYKETVQELVRHPRQSRGARVLGRLAMRAARVSPGWAN